MRTFLATFLISLLTYSISLSQCTVSDIAANGQSISNDTLVICEGDDLTMTSMGYCNSLMNNDFNTGTIGTGWTSTCSPDFGNNICDPSLDGTTYLWVGPASSQPRRLTTVTYTISAGCQICFDMDYASQGNASPCEGPDMATEGVHLQYSTDGGATWTDINYWDPVGGNDPQLTAWNHYCETVPVGGNISFSWYQDVGSGSTFDHWGIDNVEIFCPQFTDVVWNYGPTVANPPTLTNMTLGQSGWYTVTYYDNVTGDAASDSIYVNVYPSVTSGFTAVSPICVSGSTVTTYTGNGTPADTYIWDFGGGTSTPGTGQGPHTIDWAIAGTYNLSLVTGLGFCSDTTVVTVVVTPLPTAVISGTVSICDGSSANLQVDFTGTSPWDFVYSDGTNNITLTGITANPYTFSVSPTSTTTYSLVSVDDAACTGTVSGSAVVTIIPIPTSTFTVVSPICDGASTSLTYTGNALTTDTYTWDFGGGTAVPGTGQGSHTVDWATSGTYNLSLVVTNTLCTSVQTDMQVIVDPLPTAIITGSVTVCGGNTVPIQVDFTGTGPWEITYTDGTTPTTVTGITTNPYIFNVSPATPTSYSLISVDDANCTGTVSGQADVVLYTLPTAIISGTQEICDGDNADLTIDLTGTGPWDITYTNGTGTFSENGIASSPHTINVGPLSTTTTYTLTGVLDVNCTGTTYSGSAVITVHPIPTANFTYTRVDCYSEITNINYIGTASSAATYTWDFDAGNANPGLGQGPHQVNWTPSGTHVVSLVVEENNCVSPIYTQNITNPPLLVLAVTGQDLLCNNDSSGSILASPSGGTISSDYNYNWSNGGSTQIIDNLDAGIYHLTITDDQGCTETADITINEPMELIVQTPVNEYLCNGRDIVITASTTGGTPNYNYSWNGTSGGGTIIDSPRDDITYTVIVTDANGCTDTSSTMVYVSDPVTIELLSNKDSICFGDNVVVTANITSPAGGPYTLRLNDGTLISTPFEVSTDTLSEIIAIVTDGCGSEATDTLKLNFYPEPEIDFSPNIFNGCQPLLVKFNQNVSFIEGQTYLWDFGGNQQDNISYEYNPEHIFTNYGSFDVSLSITTAKGCTHTDKIYNLINVYEKPIADYLASPEVVSLIKPEVFFENLSTSTDTCYWNFNDGDTSNAVNPVHYFAESGEFEVELQITTFQGCKDTVLGKVVVEDPITFYAPTAFTPDYDGINDEFKVSGTGIDNETYVMYIFDRWGEIVYISEDIRESWDGTVGENGTEKSQVGAYTWLCTYKDIQGNDHKHTGVVMVLN